MAIISGGKVIEGARYRGATTEPPGQFATADYADGSVTSAKIADGTVANADLAGSITNAKLAAPKVVVYQETVLYSQFTDGGGTSGTFDLSTSIPAGAVFLQSMVTALTGFAGDTSATLQIGDGTTAARYSTGTPSVFATAAAGADMGVPSGTKFHSAAKTPRLTVTSGADFTAVSAGALTVTLFWYQAS